MFDGGHMMGTGYMGWMMIIFWALLLFMLILIIQWVARLGHGQKMDSPVTPLEILKNRLASGEIEIDEFTKKKQYL